MESMLADPIDGPVPEPVQKVRLERRVASGVGKAGRPRISSAAYGLASLRCSPTMPSRCLHACVVTITPGVSRLSPFMIYGTDVFSQLTHPPLREPRPVVPRSRVFALAWRWYSEICPAVRLDPFRSFAGERLPVRRLQGTPRPQHARQQHARARPCAGRGAPREVKALSASSVPHAGARAHIPTP